MKEKTQERVNQVKAHFEKHKMKYQMSGMFLGGLVVGYAFGPKVIQVIYKSDNATQIAQLSRRMHPGLIIRNNDTGEIAASMRRMAEIDGLSYSQLYKTIKHGTGPYEILGEATA